MFHFPHMRPIPQKPPRWTALVIVQTFLVFSLGLGAPAIGTEDDIVFSIMRVSITEGGYEPTMSYAPNGTVWYSGANVEPDGRLWWATSDEPTSWTEESDPPTNGSVDAVVHHDLDGRLFWAEMRRNASAPCDDGQVAVRHGSNWFQQNFTCLDRPWFRTNSTGVTFLAFANGTGGLPRVEVWSNRSGEEGWSPWSAGENNASYPATLSDFANATDGTLYLLVFNATSQGIYVSWRAPTDSTWSLTPEFSVTQNYRNAGFGILRVAVDLSGNLYVAYGDKIGTDHSAWLRRFDGGAWSAPSRLSPADNTTALPSIVVGSAGRVGVAWYEADGNFLPSEAPNETKWRFVYSVFTNANSSPQLLQRAVVADEAHLGKIVLPGSLGDFSYALRREGNPSGRVTLAFACDAISPQLRCEVREDPSPPALAYAVQTGGPGVLT